uniref:Uncharacterized protein n=2 Tax=Sphaerodactylus townsendi TaxID=933632 RepID=A0ACB8EWC3_9SAUR
MERTSDVSKEAENLLQFGNAKKNMGTPAASCGFKSSLVLSLFYSPSEDDDDDDDSEDWSSEDEIEETGQSCLDGTLLECDTAAEGHSQHQGFPENLSGSCFSNVDPPSLLCFSKSVQPVAVASPEPKNHKEIAVSFHIRQEDSRLEEFCDLPKPSEDQRSATGHPPHSSCQLGTERNCDLVTTETSLDSRKEHQTVKKVRFSSKVAVHTLVVWDYASRAARRGPWEEMARDRCRFQRRIAEVGALLKPCLEVEHRARAWERIHGALDRVP